MSTKNNYETVHDTVNRTMTHIFHPRLQLTIDFKNFELIVTKDGEVIDRMNVKGEPFSLSEYEDIITTAGQAAETLRLFE